METQPSSEKNVLTYGDTTISKENVLKCRDKTISRRKCEFRVIEYFRCSFQIKIIRNL